KAFQAIALQHDKAGGDRGVGVCGMSQGVVSARLARVGVARKSVWEGRVPEQRDRPCRVNAEANRVAQEAITIPN
ncbi:MAG: hypothetical protein ACLFVH_14190, partial [Phycisphaerae bacterium]